MEVHEAEHLLAELWEPDREDQVAWRAGQRYVARLVRSAPEKVAPQVQLTTQATYLITGGLGSLGLQVAEWLVSRGARHLVLMGRRGAAATVAQEAVRRWQEAGVYVRVARADIARVHELQSVLTEIQASMPPLRGVIHAAGILDDGILMQQQWARFAAVLAPKIAGAWNLHVLTQELQLDYFVLFSSAASVLGSAGQGNYAAANAFLDALAHYRRAQGLPALSINWGPWAEAGMAATHRIGARLAAQGIEALTPSRGLAALAHVLEHPVAQIAVLPIDWPRFVAHSKMVEIPPLLRQVAHEWRSDDAAAPTVVQRADIAQQLEHAPTTRRWELLVAYLQKEVAQVLGFPTAQSLEPQQRFFDLGMDSLTAVELKNRLQTNLGYALPTPVAFDYPSVEALGGYLVKEVLPWEFSLGVSPGSPQGEGESAQFAATLENLPPDEIADLLAQELAAIDTDKMA
jgi:short-subunit dehydrogenase/acyl carrier protein